MAAGDVAAVVANVRRRVGWRPVGETNEVLKVSRDGSASGWWREGKEKRVGSGGRVGQ